MYLQVRRISAAAGPAVRRESADRGEAAGRGQNGTGRWPVWFVRARPHGSGASVPSAAMWLKICSIMART
ncbi:hypothetical protein GCM10010464_08330 [Pseudonocardia yunnanensis]